ncbi:MAG TPA: ABC transporter substrate-binding protein [Chloroflexota bacterium]|nr:ABC transporter substrate-binding protein [Chloroflexota bacterium]
MDRLTRRRMLHLAITGCAGAALAACGSAAAPAAPASSAAAPAKPSAGASSAAPAGSASAKPAASAAAASAPAKQLSAVKVGFAALSGNGTPVVMALDAGIFQKYGLPVTSTYIQGSPNTIAALGANEVQFAVVGASASVQAALGGADVVDVATLAPGLAFRFYSQPNIKTLQQLKGGRVVQSQAGTDPDFALRLVLQKNGMSYSDVTSIHVPGADADRLQAMVTSKAEAVILGPGLFHVAEGQFHLNLLLDVIKEKIPYEQATIATSRAFTKSHPDEVLAFVRSLTESVKYIKDHRPETLASLKKFLKTDDDAFVNEAYDYYVTGGVFPRELGVSEAGIQTLLDLVGETNPAAKQKKPADFIDNSFVKKLSDEGFVTKLYGS